MIAKIKIDDQKEIMLNKSNTYGDIFELVKLFLIRSECVKIELTLDTKNDK